MRARRSVLRKKEDRQKLILCIPAVLKIFLFAYCPMIGLVIAFENFKPKDLFLSEWAGFDNFQIIFQNKDIFKLFGNAVILNLLYFFFAMVVGVILALFLYEVTKKWAIRTVQSALLIPLFVSWPLIGLLVRSILDKNGILTVALANMGIEVNFYNRPEFWRPIMTIIHVWRNAGMTMMGYYAVLLNTDKEIYEAAEIDGAGRFARMRILSVPTLVPMIVLSFIMACGNIIRSDFSMNFFIIGGTNTVLYDKVDVLESYMYRALLNGSKFGNMIAMDLTQGTIGLVMSLTVNLIIKKISPEQAIF